MKIDPPRHTYIREFVHEISNGNTWVNDKLFNEMVDPIFAAMKFPDRDPVHPWRGELLAQLRLFLYREQDE